MKRIHLWGGVRYVAVLLVVAVSMFAWSTQGYAQDAPPITASVDRTSLTTDEFLRLKVTVNASALRAPKPTLPSLEGFSIVGSSSSSQVSIINGQMSASVVYEYRLQPYQIGELVIKPITLTLKGETFSTDPITVQVTEGQSSGTPPAGDAPSSEEGPNTLSGQNLFVEADVDVLKPYLGQQVVYTFRFYQAIRIFDQPYYEAPSFMGFWNEQQPEQNQYRVTVENKVYQVTELRTILFPTAVGDVTIEPAQLTIPGGFLDQETVLQTGPVHLNVRPLPDDAPEGFNGAVGHFDISANMESTQGKVNEPLTLKVTLVGEGNLHNMPDPQWPDLDDWRAFESQATTNTEVQEGRFQGNRIYERLLVPGADGDFVIPPIEYVYFDPVAGAYQTVTTDPIPVSIAPSDTQPEDEPPPIFIGVDKDPVEQLAVDIRHLKPVPPVIERAKPPLMESRWYWLAWGIPVLALVGNFAWQALQRRLHANQGLLRSSQARKKARQALTRARQHLSQGSDVVDIYGTVGQILTSYLADKLNQPVAGLTYEALGALLAARGLSSDLVERVRVCLMRTESARFSPESRVPGHAEDLLQDLKELIDDLEQAFKDIGQTI